MKMDLYQHDVKGVSPRSMELLVRCEQQPECGSRSRDESEFLTSDGDSLSIRAAVTIVASIPRLVVYPFRQKYFVVGQNVGIVKE